MDENAPPPEHHTASDLVPLRLRQFIPVVAVIGVSLAVVGYVTGIREPAPSGRPATGAAPPGPAPPAVTYGELASAGLRPNANRNEMIAGLVYDRPGVFDPVNRTEAMKLTALADRAKNRAYDGAPPTIPHPVEARPASACLVCHGEGLKVGDRVASKMSHPLLSNCTQCHIEQSPSGLPFRADPTGNGFVGVSRAGPGERASPGAPPTIPHHTWMRQDCLSCHGLVTRAGTRTTHPWLTSCAQCHAPSAALDQVHFAGGRR